MSRLATSWHSGRLGREVSVLRWGDVGAPVLFFPTAAGDAEECERFLLVDALTELMAAQRVKLYSVDSVPGIAWLKEDSSVRTGAPVQAAVLALIMPAIDAHGERLLLIERARGLTTHAGQLAFPGGKREPGDRDLLDTALRESKEEVGLDRRSVQILGRLEPVPTPTRFFIVPFVGRLLDPWVPERCSGEVANILTPSLSELCDPSLHSVSDVRRWRGRDYHLHEFAIHDPPLWGATARMTYELLTRASLVEAI